MGMKEKLGPVRRIKELRRLCPPPQSQSDGEDECSAH